jgi:hypothetical protein
MRFAAGLALIVLAIAAGFYALLIYWAVGWPSSRQPGVMHTTSITFGSLTLVGWQMYASYFVLAALALAFLAGGFALLVITLFRLTRRSSERLPVA